MINLINDFFFEIDERGSSISHELNAGVTTFLAMVYITVVNPLILTDAGMDFGAVFVASCAAAFGCLVMGLVANYLIALRLGWDKMLYLRNSSWLRATVANGSWCRIYFGDFVHFDFPLSFKSLADQLYSA